jgi:hypothetical protein
MVETKQHIKIKKRIMFNKEYDYYFITYNILIFLCTIGCLDERSKFQDYTKLAYIIPFISYPHLLDIQTNYTKTERYPMSDEVNLMREIYIKSRMKVKLIASILFALERNNLISLERNTIRNSIDIWVNKDKVPSSFIDSTLYKLEIEQANRFKKIFPKIKSLKTATLVESLFSDKGVSVWGV